MFYTFSQSNPGGRYDDSMPMYVIIQASSSEQANKRAESVGVYFDGIEQGRDCECCNDRWGRVDDYEGKENPEIYGEDVREGNRTDYKIYYFTPLEKLL